jgi:hypothetical protein
MCRFYLHFRKELQDKLDKRHMLARLITEYLYKQTLEIKTDDAKEEILIEFSVQELKKYGGNTTGNVWFLCIN